MTARASVRTIFRALTIAALMSGGVAAVPVGAAEPGTMRLSYDLTFSGADLGDLSLEGRYAADGFYRGNGAIVTSGIANRLAPLTARMAAVGQSLGHDRIGMRRHLQPRAYSARFSSGERSQDVEIGFDETGPQSVRTNPPRDLSRFPVTPAQKDGAIDPLTALLSLSGRAGEPISALCGRTIKVFDGRRRFDLVIEDAKPRTERKKTAFGEREITVCSVTLQPVAGFMEDEPDSSAPPEFDLWYTRLEGRLVPVALRIALSFGSGRADLTEAVFAPLEE